MPGNSRDENNYALDFYPGVIEQLSRSRDLALEHDRVLGSHSLSAELVSMRMI
jgi:hypothetical protein